MSCKVCGADRKVQVAKGVVACSRCGECVAIQEPASPPKKTKVSPPAPAKAKKAIKRSVRPRQGKKASK